jgi:large subunit ribosomal protein L35
MPKLKTKSSAKKRFLLTATGMVKMKSAGKRHNMRRRPNDTIRDTRGMRVMHPSDAKRVYDYYFHM